MFPISSIQLLCCLLLWASHVVHAAPMYPWDPNQSWNPAPPGSTQAPNAAQTWQAGSSHVQGSHVWNGQQWVFVYAPPRPVPWDVATVASSSAAPMDPRGQTQSWIHAPGSTQASNAAQTWQTGSSHVQGSHVGNGQQWVPIYAQSQPDPWNGVTIASPSIGSNDPHASVSEGLTQSYRNILGMLERQLSLPTSPSVHDDTVPDPSVRPPQQEASVSSASDQSSNTDSKSHKIKTVAKTFKTKKVAKNNRAKNVATAPETNTKSTGFPAPDSLQRIEPTQAFTTEHFSTQVYFNENEQVKARIKSELFGDNIEWIKFNDIKYKADYAWYNRSPIARESRRLPISYESGTGRSKIKMEVYMTEQGHPSNRLSSIGSTLHYQFWGRPVTLTGSGHQIQYLGTGIVRNRANEAVNTVLGEAHKAVR